MMEKPPPFTGVTYRVSFLNEYLQAVRIALDGLVATPESYPHRIIYCAALMMYFEYGCNTAIVDFAQKNVAADDRAAYIKKMQFLSAPKKVRDLFGEITLDAYKTNMDHPEIACLFDFIRIRNSIVHHVDAYTALEGEDVEPIENGVRFVAAVMDRHIDSITPAAAQTYLNIIMAFTDAVMAAATGKAFNQHGFVIPNH